MDVFYQGILNIIFPLFFEFIDDWVNGHSDSYRSPYEVKIKRRIHILVN